MRSHKTLILSRKDIENLVDIKKAIDCVESAFRELGQGKAQMPAKIYLNLKKYGGDFRAMPAYLEGLNSCALKWVNVHPRNRSIGLPTVMATIILSDPKNALPLSFMDGTYVTDLRTAAAGGVAAKYLANKDSKIIGLIGCGAQAITQLMALRHLFKIKEVKVWGNKKHYINDFIKKMKKRDEQMNGTESLKDCVNECDIVVTTTPSRRPLVKFRWLKKGVHINAIGADAAGKQELEPTILKKAKVIIDDWSQASYSGEINVPLKKKVITKKNIHADIGEIVTGQKKGRINTNDITVFDSTGLAIQDVAIAQLIYKTALRRKIGKSIQIL